MEKISTTVSYKTKIRQFSDGVKYIDYKKSISRHDCNLQPHQHYYFNSDMFPSMLKRAALVAQNNREWCRLSDLPESVIIDESGFLATVTLKILV